MPRPAPPARRRAGRGAPRLEPIRRLHPDPNGMTPRHILDRIDRPLDLHELDEDQLEQVAREVGATSSTRSARSAGTLGRTSARARLAVALHSLLDSPRDKILWDVGHQAYPHKVLTGRRDQLPTIRRYDGLAPSARSTVRARHHGRGPRLDGDGYAVGLKEEQRLRATTRARSSWSSATAR